MNHTQEIRTLKEERLHAIYLTASIRELEKCIDDPAKKPSNIIKNVFYGIKSVITIPLPTSKEEAEAQFNMIIGVKYSMSLLTLDEFMNIFPITKFYDGEKWGIKDYYSTLEAIKELGLQPNERIGENILELIMEYMNEDILAFAIQGAVVMSAIRRFDGHLDIIEEFMAEQGEDTPNTFKNSKGSLCIYDMVNL